MIVVKTTTEMFVYAEEVCKHRNLEFECPNCGRTMRVVRSILLAKMPNDA